ncbi:hypothetical protein ACFYUV_11355 [Nonomuraea sp. NPDC003560]|uniref:hypothetical protein n=1 Tax=Nonomuraea sp. NPDC003560 TaxID=3364341 RepID=UPI003698B1FB
MADRPPLTDAQALDRAVFTLEVAAGLRDFGAALAGVRITLSDLDTDELRSVAARLAVHAVRAMPPADVARWLDTLRLEHLMQLDLAGREPR